MFQMESLKPAMYYSPFRHSSSSFLVSAVPISAPLYMLSEEGLYLKGRKYIPQIFQVRCVGMGKRPVKILDHRLHPLIFRILFQHRLVSLSHAHRHLSLAHISPCHRIVSRQMGRNFFQDPVEILFRAPEPCRTEQKYPASVEGF